MTEPKPEPTKQKRRWVKKPRKVQTVTRAGVGEIETR